MKTEDTKGGCPTAAFRAIRVLSVFAAASNKTLRRNSVLTTIRDVFSRLEKLPFFLHNVVRLYRVLRVFCCLIEDRYRGISEDAGFKVAIAWTEELGFDREVL